MKVGLDLQAVLITRPGFRVAKYVGKHGWISVDEHALADDAELERLIRRSYDLVTGAAADCAKPAARPGARTKTNTSTKASTNTKAKAKAKAKTSTKAKANRSAAARAPGAARTAAPARATKAAATALAKPARVRGTSARG